MNESAPLGLTTTLPLDFAAAEARVIEALKAEGFGVLTEINVRETLKKKLDVDFRPYKILGACNPSLAHRALQAAPEVGLLLPCNVTLSQEPQGVRVSLVDPLAMMAMLTHPALRSVAEEARTRLERVLAALRLPDAR